MTDRSPIEVRMPVPHDLVPVPVPVAGFGEAFEGTVIARIRQGATVLTERVFQTSMMVVMPFVGELDLPEIPADPAAVLEVFGDDPRDDPEREDPGVNLSTVPIVLGPAIRDDYHGYALHEVKSGDTLSAIANKWSDVAKITWQQIFAANGDLIDDPNVIRPGMVLRIPM